MRKVSRQIPNILTGIRGLGAIALWFVGIHSNAFLILYLVCGFSDMIDGTIARKLHAESKFGERFDSVCDFLFVAVCMVKVLPAVQIPLWVWIWIGVTAAIKIVNLVTGLCMRQKTIFLHTITNKLMGGLLFLTPLAIRWIDISYIAAVLCPVATFAAIEEAYKLRKMTSLSQPPQE